jgi:hypothetical protein
MTERLETETTLKPETKTERRRIRLSYQPPFSLGTT